jgi:cellulose synthase/poly-beta-1,6-N-acetylglucosamine synthase-like glycosyltransferase
MKPFVSIVIPVYNSENTLKSCLNALVDRDYPKDKYEIILVNDNSTDKSAEIMRFFAARHPSIKIIAQETGKKGPASARNLGIKHAKGEIIASTDSDCIVPKYWLCKIVEYFESYPDVSAIGGSLIACSSNRFITNCEGMISDCTGHKAKIATPNAAFRKNCIEKVGLFNESMVSGEDPDLVWNIEKAGLKVVFLEDLPVVHHYYRSTLSSFIRHHVWYGKGRVLLAKRHPEKFSFAERNFLQITAFLLIFTFVIFLFYPFEDFPWAILFLSSFLIFSFGRRLRLMSKVSEKYSFVNSIKCSLLFPVIDLANLYGMTKQKFGLK